VTLPNALLQLCELWAPHEFREAFVAHDDNAGTVRIAGVRSGQRLYFRESFGAGSQAIFDQNKNPNFSVLQFAECPAESGKSLNCSCRLVLNAKDDK
jgi:hypothetical protein